MEGKAIESLVEARQQVQSLDRARQQVLAEAGPGGLVDLLIKHA